MVLSKLFKPFVSSFGKEKWKSRNTQVRKKAVLELPVNEQEIIADIALNDSDESIRCLAINKSSSLDLLQSVIMKGTNQAVKKTAETRFYQLLSGLKHPIPEYGDREKIIRGSRNPALLEYIAEHAQETEFRQIAIKRINRDALLGNIALKDASSDVRLTAAQQIAKRSTLERVLKQSRRKDKRVYKTVKTKLDHIIEDEERPLLLAKEVEDICYHLERLYKRGRLLQEKPTYDNYKKRWESIKNFASEATRQRFVDACAQIDTGIAELQQEKVRQQQAIHTLESMLSELSDTVDDILQAREINDHKAVSDKKNSLDKRVDVWNEIADKLPAEQTKILNSRFQALLELTESSPAEQNEQSSASKLIVLCSQIESMLETRDFLPKHSIDALDSKFHAQVKLITHQTADIGKCIQTFEQSLSTLRERLKLQSQKADELKKQIQSTLLQIESQIDEGQISRAEKSRNNLFRQIDHSHLLSSGEKHQYLQNLNQFRSELGKFSSWRNWAHENEREHLTQQAEQLWAETQKNEDLQNSHHEVVAQVKSLRQDWKRLKSPGSDELWKRFNEACSQSYELCTPYLDKEAEAREAHLQAKQALCEQLEQYIESMHWPSDPLSEIDSSIDWIKVDQIIRQARKEWNSTGFVDRKAHKVISRRFDNSITIIRAELKRVWDGNQEKFYQIINQVKALHELLDTDLDQAIEKAKKLQKEWKKIGPVQSYQRNKLWKKFRANCDLIFNKRQDIIAQHNLDNEIILREKEAICENFEALNQQPLSIPDLQNAYQDIAALWKENEPKLRAMSKALNQRYAAAKAEYENKLDTLYAAEKTRQLQLFKQKAELCKQLERLPSTEQTQIDQILANWDQLPSLPAKMETLIKTRFNNAMQHLHTDKATLIQAESAQKQQMCLKYEILSGQESPPEQQQARREMQVELLNSSLSGRQGEQSLPDPVDIQIQWHSLSNYEYEGDAEIEERFSRLV